MSTILFPFTIANGDPEDAGPVMANFQAVSAVVNGALEMGTNVVADPPSAQTGAAISEGVSQSAARADHQHAIRGFEQFTSDPTTSNFLGRVYMNTSTSKIRMCVNASGSGAWVTMGNMGAADLPNHATNHIAGGADALSPPMVSATRTSNQSIATGTPTALTWNATDVFDTDSMHDTSSNTSRITFTHAGVYHITASIAWDVNNAGLRQTWLNLNGAATALDYGVDNAPSATKESYGRVTALYKASASDYVEVMVNQNSGGNLNVLGTSATLSSGSVSAPRFFSAHWVGTGS